jgi:hypothetical protein
VKAETFAEMVRASPSPSNAWRYDNETIDALAAESPKLGAALAKVAGTDCRIWS